MREVSLSVLNIEHTISIEREISLIGSRKSLGAVSINVQQRFWNLINPEFLCRQTPNSVEAVSSEDDIVEVPMDENSNKKQETKEKRRDELSQENFLRCLLLITNEKALELQNKRTERKRRSTANPQFVYSMAEQPAVSIYWRFRLMY